MTGWRFDCGMLAPARWLVFLALIVGVQQPGDAQSPANEASLNADGARRGSLIASSHGKIVVVAWYAGDAKSSVIVVSVSHDGGRSMSKPVGVGSANFAGRPLPPVVSVVARQTPTGADTILAAWSAVRQGQAGVAFAQSRDLGKSFQELFFRPGDLPAKAELSSLTIAQDGRLHALWQAGSDLLYARTEGRTFSGTRRIDTAASACVVSALGVSNKNVVTAFWYRRFAAADEEFAVARATGAAGEFAPLTRASRERWGFRGCPSASPSLLVDVQGAVRFVFQVGLNGARPTSSFFTDRLTPEGVLRPRAFVDTVGFTDARSPRLASDREGGLSLGWEGTRNGRRYVMIRHSPGVAGGAGGLDADWMRPGPPIVLDHSGQGTAPAIAPLSDGVLALWVSGEPVAPVVRTRRLTVDELCGLPPAPARAKSSSLPVTSAQRGAKAPIR